MFAVRRDPTHFLLPLATSPLPASAVPLQRPFASVLTSLVLPVRLSHSLPFALSPPSLPPPLTVPAALGSVLT